MSLTRRLLLYAFVIISVLVVAVVTITDRRLHVRITDEITTGLGREARLIATQWSDIPSSDDFANAAGKAVGHRVTLIDPFGRVIGDSEFDAAGIARLANHATRPEVVQARSTGIGSSRRQSTSKGDEEIYVAVRAANGVVRVSIPTRSVNEIFSRSRRDIATAGLGAMLIALLLASLFARNVSRPISELRDVAKAMEGHDFSRPKVDAPGEVGELASTIYQLGSKIESLETTRRDFVANVSHELRTPLTIVGGFAETLVEDDPPPEKRKEFAAMILSNTRRMQRIVDEILDLSRIESGGWVPRPVMSQAASIIGDVVESFQGRARAKGVMLSSSIQEEMPPVFVDPTSLRQILANLVENSLRHTASGEVVVSAEASPSGSVISVSDTGEGIPQEHLPRVFERFYRVDSGRSRDQGGTGLGLAIVKHMVEAHRGRVTIQSEPGKGTTISIWLPFPAA